MDQLLRRFLRRLRGHPVGGNNGELFGRLTLGYREAIVLVKAFYVLLLFFSINQIVYGADWLALTYLAPLWPVAWLNWLPLHTGLYMVGILGIMGPLAAVLFTPNRWIRLAAFIAFLEIAALSNSFGKINHHLHGWLAFAFVFIFLPHGGWTAVRPSTTHKQTFLLIFASAQLFFMSFYSLSGAWKIFAGLEQIWLGQTYHTFHPYAMSQQVAHRLLQTNTESVLGWLVIEHPLLGALPYWAVVYMELFAVVAALRPSLHKVWGTALILFHMGTWLTMTIAFNTNMILLGLFFLLSPFSPTHLRGADVFNNLPLLRHLGRLKASGATK